MTCQEFWNEMPELRPGTGPHVHLSECSSCRTMLERQDALAAGLRQIAKDRHRIEAPVHVEKSLLNVFREHTGEIPANAPVPRWSHLLTWASAVAAVIVLGVFLIRDWRPAVGQPQHPGVQVASLQADEEAGVQDSDFIPLPSALESNGGDDDDVVRVEVSRSALVALGLPLAGDGGGADRVEAEVALGTDGTLEGIRILQ